MGGTKLRAAACGISRTRSATSIRQRSGEQHAAPLAAESTGSRGNPTDSAEQAY